MTKINCKMNAEFCDIVLVLLGTTWREHRGHTSPFLSKHTSSVWEAPCPAAVTFPNLPSLSTKEGVLRKWLPPPARASLVLSWWLQCQLYRRTYSLKGSKSLWKSKQSTMNTFLLNYLWRFQLCILEVSC